MGVTGQKEEKEEEEKEEKKEKEEVEKEEKKKKNCCGRGGRTDGRVEKLKALQEVLADLKKWCQGYTHGLAKDLQRCSFFRTKHCCLELTWDLGGTKVRSYDLNWDKIFAT